MTDEDTRRLVLSRPIPERLIQSLKVAPLLRPDYIDMWVRCGGVISNPMPHVRMPDPRPTVGWPSQRLSPRERQAIGLLAQGMTHKEAAHHMGIDYRSYGKLTALARFRLDQSKTCERAVLVAAARGIIPLPEGKRIWRPMALTAERYETLKYVARGLTNLEIAESMGVAEETVKTRVRALLESFGVKTRVELASLCYRQRIV
jgi:DNA-binding NarL/FixJ family response regulator